MSSKTLGFLGDQFEVEPAHGEKREQVLRTAGIETYFILRARYPVINTFLAALSGPCFCFLYVYHPLLLTFLSVSTAQFFFYREMLHFFFMDRFTFEILLTAFYKIKP